MRANDPISSCLSLAERIKVLDALAREEVIALSAGHKTATLLPKKPSSPPPPEESASPLDRWPDQRRWFIELLWNERSPTTGLITTSPAMLLVRADVLPSKEAAQEVVGTWIKAGLLRDEKPGGRYPRYSFPIDPTAITPSAGDAVRTAADQSREAQKRRADLEAAQTELEQVTEEIDLLYPRFQALLTRRDELTEKIRQLQAR